ncbi:Dabb family protein [Diaminobutyricibacter sp. McL0608]|uniref:Dabb family protein n=1 Tax=Leifsonia sp. McL0608 TaxID=3143537 RepID=UPI0031F2F9BA
MESQPPIRHTVVFRLRHAAGSAEESDFIRTASVVLPGIPGVQEFAVSRQVSPKSTAAFQFAMTFASQADYDAYNAHPDHRQFVATRWDYEVDSFQEYDFVGY